MAGLNDINPDLPLGSDLLSVGDDRLRALAAKVIECIGLEHSLAGMHKLPHGPLSQRPAFGNTGRLFILETAGMVPELQYDSGTAWISLTRNNQVDSWEDGLAAHRAAIPIDHPIGSVQHQALAVGHVLAKHLDASVPDDLRSLAGLVNGTVLPTSMHFHALGEDGGGIIDSPPATNPNIITIPAGMSMLEVFMWGAGAGGAGYSSPFTYHPAWAPSLSLFINPSGGAGGGFASGKIRVLPGEQYSIKVGIGGIGGIPGVFGIDGGDTWLKKVGSSDPIMFADGGKADPIPARVMVYETDMDSGEMLSTQVATYPNSGADAGRGAGAGAGDIISGSNGITSQITVRRHAIGADSLTVSAVGALSGSGSVVPGGGGNAGTSGHTSGYPGANGKLWMNLS